MKPLLNLPQLSTEALLNGAGMFIVPCSVIERNESLQISLYAPYKAGDEVYLQEDCCQIGCCHYEKPLKKSCIENKCDLHKVFKATITNVKVVRVKEIFNLGISALLDAWSKNENDFINWYNKQYNNSDENQHVFLYTVKKLK